MSYTTRSDCLQSFRGKGGTPKGIGGGERKASPATLSKTGGNGRKRKNKMKNRWKKGAVNPGDRVVGKTERTFKRSLNLG